MALAYDGAIQRLIDAFGRLPGIGPKGAQRIAFYMLSAPEDEARDLAEAIEEVKAAVLERVLAAGCAELEPEEAAELEALMAAAPPPLPTAEEKLAALLAALEGGLQNA